ncbi:nitrate/nitrite transporter NrtS [Flavobacterium chilense]|uniref:Uncharacterized protein n=1 Tax=Flavobacterium chilense TaxID=946677 RepID=A0A1M7MCA6_9FLAO|nr:hypothetical protein SAMN05444484_11220 [Flavobacterium chilense]
MKKENYYIAIKIALIVGTLLNLINNYHAIFSNSLNTKICFQLISTYFVPFFVSIYSQWKANDANK